MNPTQIQGFAKHNLYDTRLCYETQMFLEYKIDKIRKTMACVTNMNDGFFHKMKSRNS